MASTGSSLRDFTEQARAAALLKYLVDQLGDSSTWEAALSSGVTLSCSSPVLKFKAVFTSDGLELNMKLQR